MKSKLFAAFFLWVFVSEARAVGLTIHASEIGVGRFHAQDNAIHPYVGSSGWVNYILPTQIDELAVIDNPDQSVTIFFTNLEELLQKTAEVAKSHHQKIQVFNVHAHGGPGLLWFPKNAHVRDGWQCKEWREAAVNPFDSYYRAISESEFRRIHKMGNSQQFVPCSSGLKEWQEMGAKNPELKDLFEADAQIHLLSCVSGLGIVGAQFTEGLAQMFFSSPAARVESLVNFGLADWSVPEGVGFYDCYGNCDEEQERYAQARRDREFLQKGDIRVSTIDEMGKSHSSFIKGVDFLPLEMDERQPNSKK